MGDTPPLKRMFHVKASRRRQAGNRLWAGDGGVRTVFLDHTKFGGRNLTAEHLLAHAQVGTLPLTRL